MNRLEESRQLLSREFVGFPNSMAESYSNSIITIGLELGNIGYTYTWNTSAP